MHFVESLAIWLRNFEQLEERQAAYRFIKEHLVFISEAEMRHLVSLAYPGHIRPTLLRKAARELRVPNYAIAKIVASDAFQRSERQSLFLGLSDGARIDILRRMSELNNEQVYATYQLSNEKAADMLGELKSDLNSHAAGDRDTREGFKTLFLLDDFAGSGHSLLRQEDGSLKGKIAKCLDSLIDLNSRTHLLDLESLRVYIVLYLATQRALDTLNERLQLLGRQEWPPCEVTVVHVLNDNIRVDPQHDHEIDRLLVKYYDSSIMDKHLKKGGSDVIYGYAQGSLPLVLSHNTPNNSVYLLWADKPGLRTKALFPRVSRHREDL